MWCWLLPALTRDVLHVSFGLTLRIRPAGCSWIAVICYRLACFVITPKPCIGRYIRVSSKAVLHTISVAVSYRSGLDHCQCKQLATSNCLAEPFSALEPTSANRRVCGWTWLTPVRSYAPMTRRSFAAQKRVIIRSTFFFYFVLRQRNGRRCAFGRPSPSWLLVVADRRREVGYMENNSYIVASLQTLVNWWRVAVGDIAGFSQHHLSRFRGW